MRWDSVRIKDVSEITMGQSPKGSSYNKDGVGLPLLNGAADYKNEVFNPKQFTSEPTKVCDKGDILICIRATLGNFAFADQKYCLGRGVAAVKVKSGNSSNYIRKVTEVKIDRIFNRSTGSTIKGIKKDDLENLQIPLPPLPIQQQIAEILDTADALRQKTQAQLDALDELAQSVFLEMFGDVKIYNQKTLEELISKKLRNGISPSSKGKHKGKVLTLSAITRGEFNLNARKEGYFDKPHADYDLVNKDDFLICRGNGNLKLVGRARFPTKSLEDTSFPDTMIAARIDKEKIIKEYLNYIWSTTFIRSQIERKARTTNGTHKVNQKTIGSILIPIPSIILQNQFAQILQNIEAQRTKLKKALQESEDLLNALLQEIFQWRSTEI